MDENTLSHYGWMIITLIISIVLIMFATQYNKDIKNKTNEDVDKIISIATEQEEIIYE